MLGFFDASSVLGPSETIQVSPRRAIGPFTAQVTVEERHSDTMVITDHPVESGAVISDHAYMLPAVLVIRAGWSDSPRGEDDGGGFLSNLGGLIGGTVGQTLSGISSRLSGISSSTAGEGVGSTREMYQNMLELQKSRIPMEVMTGKRLYKNMLIRTIDTMTDKENENSTILTIELREVQIVTTQVVSVGAPPEDQEEPESTTPTVEKGNKQLQPANNYDAAAGEASAAASASSR